MAGKTDMAGGRLVKRLITFYVILAVIGVAVVVLVISKGGNEKAQPAIAGGYAAAAANPCIGPIPKPAAGAPAAGDRTGTGRGDRPLVQRAPVRAVRQLHQQSEHPRWDGAPPDANACRRRPQDDRDDQLRVRRQVAEHRCGGDARSEGIDRRHARRPSVLRRTEDSPARPGRGRAADADQHSGHVLAVSVLDLLRQLVLDSRHRSGSDRSTPPPARTSARSPTRPRRAGCSGMSSASRAGQPG